MDVLLTLSCYRRHLPEIENKNAHKVYSAFFLMGQ
jgi:hypothetical protein